MSCCKYHLKSLYDIKLTVLRQKIYLLFDGDIQLLRKNMDDLYWYKDDILMLKELKHFYFLKALSIALGVP